MASLFKFNYKRAVNTYLHCELFEIQLARYNVIKKHNTSHDIGCGVSLH